MAKLSTPEWVRFRVGEPNRQSNWVNPDCVPLYHVSHVTHLSHSFQVLMQGRIRRELVFDQSKLNTERILVTWLSPNDWSGAGGFRYGNVRFTFDWVNLIKGKRFYWVESIAYGIPAARILITDADRSDILDEYDPTNHDGPWWFDAESNTHYWNGGFCLEVMYEGDLEAAECAKVDFVHHHKRRCSVEPGECPDHGLDEDQAGALFLAELLFRELGESLVHWAQNREPDDYLARAFRYIRRELLDVEPLKYRNACESRSPTGRAVARALIGAFARRNTREMKLLLGLFSSPEAAVESIGRLVKRDLGLNNWREMLL